jgi:DNA-binding response OmpR family regulator
MKKILIIDDDELITMTLRNVLKKEGFEVFDAENGVIGLELYKTHSPDLVITDMLMPDKEGLETITDLKAINPSCKIIAMSGGGSTQNMTFLELAKKVGADRVMEKPVRPADMIQTVKGLINS